MTPRDHLKSVPAFYINMADAAERRNHIESTFSNVFKSLTRVEPFAVINPKQEGIEAKRKLIDTGKNYDPDGILRNLTVYRDLDMDRFATRKPRPGWQMVWTPENYAAQDSLFRTTRELLRKIVNCGYDRAVIMDDDCDIRDGFLDADMTIPEADIIVWGGASRSYVSDVSQFAHGHPWSFRMLDGKPAYFSHCYEVTAVGAKKMLEVFDSVPAGTVDTLWLIAFTKCRAYAVIPMGFIQSGTDSQIQAINKNFPKTVDEAKQFVGLFEKYGRLREAVIRYDNGEAIDEENGGQE